MLDSCPCCQHPTRGETRAPEVAEDGRDVLRDAGGVEHLHRDPVPGLHVLSLGGQDGSGAHMRYIDTPH